MQSVVASVSYSIVDKISWVLIAGSQEALLANYNHYFLKKYDLQEPLRIVSMLRLSLVKFSKLLKPFAQQALHATNLCSK